MNTGPLAPPEVVCPTLWLDEARVHMIKSQFFLFLFIMAEAYLRDLENVWRSERLVFRATQQEDYNFIFNRKSLLDTTLTPSRRGLSHL